MNDSSSANAPLRWMTIGATALLLLVLGWNLWQRSRVPATTPVAETPPSVIAPREPVDVPPTDDPYWETAVQLMPLIDPQRDAICGQWVRAGPAIVSDDIGDFSRGAARLQIPYELPAEYDFRVSFTRLRGHDAVLLFVASAGRSIRWAIGAQGGQLMGFENAGRSRTWSVNRAAVRMESPLANGVRHTCVLQVRTNGLTAYLDRERAVTWPTDYADFNPSPTWNLPDQAAPGLGSWSSSTMFHSAELIEITGHGKPKPVDPHREEPSVELPVSEPPAAADGDSLEDITAASQQVEEGARFTDAQADEAEARLRDDPDDLPARARLLGYYFAKARRASVPEAVPAVRRRHILWTIEHHPEDAITTRPAFSLDPAGHPLADAEGYRQARALWLQQIDRRKDDVRVLTHAARFFQVNDKALALTCLKRALQLAPGDHRVASQLGYTYALAALGVTMLNGIGLPASAEPAEASGEVAQAAIGELRASANPAVIARAGQCLADDGGLVYALTHGVINRDSLAEELLLRTAASETNSWRAPETLAKFYASRREFTQDPGQRRALAQKSLAQARRVVDLTAGQPDHHLYALNAAAKIAVDAEALDEARRFANDLLGRVADPPDVAGGQHYHDGHMVLGRVALRENKLQEAKNQLLQAGRTPGGGTLDSFGPNLTLAKELADRGELETVRTYLEQCRAFWPGREVDRMIQTLKEGKVPDMHSDSG